MTPAARFAAAIDIMDYIATGQPAEPALLRWARGHRFAGSKDRAAIRDIVFSIERRRASCAAMGGGASGRALIRGYLAQEGIEENTVFGVDAYAPPVRTDDPPLTPLEALSEADQADLQPWVLNRLKATYADQAIEIASALRHRAPVWLRVNTARTTREAVAARLAAEGFDPAASDACATALEIRAKERQLAQHALVHDGHVEFQDLGPQIAMEALEIEAGTRVLDYCAGGGGKALAAAAAGAVVTAHDADLKRMAHLPERAARAGAEITLSDGAPASSAYDLVICDVPCSGSGAWRRATHGKWQLSDADLSAFITKQRQIVAESLASLKPEGRLAYMTCSLFAEENAAQAAYFAEHFGLQPLTQRQLTPLEDADGFFYAIFRKSHNP